MATVTATIKEELYKTAITANNKSIIADEPVDLGGKDLGFSPKELLAASLASCKAITLKMFAQRKEWPLQEANITVNLLKNQETNTEYLETSIDLIGDLTEEQKEKLLLVSKKCPVHKLLESSIEIITL